MDFDLNQEYAGYLSNLPPHELVALWNEYCEDVNYMDDQIYPNEEETWSMISPGDLPGRIQYGDFNVHHEWLAFDGYGNFKTTNDPEDFMDLEALAEWLYDRGSDAVHDLDL